MILNESSLDVMEEEVETLPEKTQDPPQTNIEGKTPSPSKAPEQAEKTKTVTISKLYQSYGCQVTYVNRKKYQNYPKSVSECYFVIEAGRGKKLLVYSFDVTNKKSSTKNFRLMEAGINYQLTTGSGGKSKPLLNALPNDLQYIDVAIQGGKSTKAVLVFEIPETEKAADCTLSIKSGDNEAVISGR